MAGIELRKSVARALCAGSLLVGLVASAPAGEPREAATRDDVPFSIGDVPWDEGAVEHLFNRAAFGISPREIAGMVERRPEEVVDQLVNGGKFVEPFLAQRYGAGRLNMMSKLAPNKGGDLKARIRAEEKRHLHNYGTWWIDNMLSGVDPLRDRMTLFWHGFFTTNARELRRNYEVIRQHQMLRENALESYAVMLDGIVHDPAMIYYLDNASNRSGKPNENLARELMELFSLGEGNYSEDDVREVARALTGYSANREGQFVFKERHHDAGMKRILGEEGEFDGDDLVGILLRQEACAEWVAGSIIAYLEGVEPSEKRLQNYAELLRENDYRLQPLLGALLLDPAFYRTEVVGARVQAPVELVVSTSRRLGMKPPAAYVYEAASSLGQRLFEPPNVKGWEEGVAWITSASMLQRGNVAGLMLGVVDLERMFAGRPAPEKGRGARMDSMMDQSMEMSMAGRDNAGRDNAGRDNAGRDNAGRDMAGRDKAGSSKVPKSLEKLRRAVGEDYQPPINLSWRMKQAGARTDGMMVDQMLADLLAIEPPPELRGPLIRYLRTQRERLDVQAGKLLDYAELSEHLLRRLAHLILSLPEAQLG